MAAAEIQAVVEAQSFLGMLDNGDGSVLDALMRAPS
jgi:hypothetical protein